MQALQVLWFLDRGTWTANLSGEEIFITSLLVAAAHLITLRHAWQEALWHFKAPSCGVDVPLLVACRVAEPRIAFSCPALNFRRVLIGTRAHTALELVNDEALPLAFDITMPAPKAGGGSGKRDHAHTHRVPVIVSIHLALPKF